LTKIGLISTRSTNIGDDLIRTGIQRLLGHVLADSDLKWVLLNKHRPLEIYRNRALASAVDALPRGRRTASRALPRIARRLTLAHIFDDVDFVVQCGTPMMWPDCQRAEWLPAVWEDVLARADRPRVLNLAAGACYPWSEPRPTRLSATDAQAVRRILHSSDRVTFRDMLARDLAADLGFDGAVLPCTATHWAHGTRSDEDAEAVIINVMPRGGHFTWGQDLVESTWHREIDHVVATLGKEHQLILLCHNTAEYDFAARWGAHERCLATTPADYLAVARRGRVGLVNRMHAAVALAGIGVPSVAVGTDTRLLMVELVGQETSYVGDVVAADLLEAVGTLLRERAQRRARLLAIEADSFTAHAQEVAGFLDSVAA
jgi:hypothetical protein